MEEFISRYGLDIIIALGAVIIFVYIIVQLQEWILKIAWLLLLALAGAFVYFHGGFDLGQKKEFQFLDNAKTHINKHLPDKERLSETAEDLSQRVPEKGKESVRELSDKANKSMQRLRKEAPSELSQKENRGGHQGSEVIGRRQNSREAESANSHQGRERRSLLEF